MNRKIIFILLFFILTMSLFAFGGREKEVVQITGVVRLVGSALFPELVISDSDHVWHITADEVGKLIEMQHQTVSIEGEETVIELKFANGQPAGLRRELRNIKIITVE